MSSRGAENESALQATVGLCEWTITGDVIPHFQAAVSFRQSAGELQRARLSAQHIQGFPVNCYIVTPYLMSSVELFLPVSIQSCGQ